MAVKPSNTGGHIKLHEPATVDWPTDRQTHKEAYNLTKTMYIRITDALLYVQYAEFSVNLR